VMDKHSENGPETAQNSSDSDIIRD
jgi:hypothetical protein